jgi:tetratricopeptide (TPR) repeat protein
MKSPSEIAAEAVRDELYARATFARLIALPAVEFRAAVERDPRAQTEFMARHILDYREERYDSLPLEDGFLVAEAASIAASTAEPHVRCRAEKDLANSLRYLGRFADARAALERSAALARQTYCPGIHAAAVHFGLYALHEEVAHSEEAAQHESLALNGFEKNGAYDRAHVVRLYHAAMKSLRGEHAQALAVHQEAARRSLQFGCEEQLGRDYYNIGHAYRGLSDFSAAREYFVRASRIFRRQSKPALEARALRCAARMTIRLKGEAGLDQMDVAKRAFLVLGLAGEVCRSSIASIEELREQNVDLLEHCRELEREAYELGVLSTVRVAVERLSEAAREGEVTDDLLTQAWEAFGRKSTLGAISGVELVRN